MTSLEDKIREKMIRQKEEYEEYKKKREIQTSSLMKKTIRVKFRIKND